MRGADHGARPVGKGDVRVWRVYCLAGRVLVEVQGVLKEGGRGKGLCQGKGDMGVGFWGGWRVVEGDCGCEGEGEEGEDVHFGGFCFGVLVFWDGRINWEDRV